MTLVPRRTFLMLSVIVLVLGAISPRSVAQPCPGGDDCGECGWCIDCIKCILLYAAEPPESGCSETDPTDCFPCPPSGSSPHLIEQWATRAALAWWHCRNCGEYFNPNDAAHRGELIDIVIALMDACGFSCEEKIFVLENILGRPLSCAEKGYLCGYDEVTDDWCEICPERPQCNPYRILPLPVPGDDLVGGDGSGWGSGGSGDGSGGGDLFGHDFDYCRELGRPCRGDGSENGVNLRNGAANLNAIDLALPAPGFAWRVGRAYSAQQWEEDGNGDMAFYDSDAYQGRNWFQISQPVLFLADAPNGDSYDRLYYYSGPQAKLELRRVDTGSGYSTDTWEAVGLAAAAAEKRTTTIESTTYDYYILYDKSGTQTFFFGEETAYGNAAWQFWKKVDRGGNTAYVGHATDPSQAKDGYTSGGYIETVYDSGGRRYCYTYSTIDSAVRLTEVICEIDAGGGWGDCGTETEVAKVEYSYYQTGGTTYGDAGNLKMVTVTTPLTDSSLSMVTRTYYRYYTGSWSTSNPGRSYAVQYVYNSEGLRRYDEEIGNTLESETESNLEPYAAAYYEYDEDRRIEVTWQNGECGCSGAVDGATIYRYEFNSMLWEDDWLRRTIVSRPDGTYLTQYSGPTGLSTNTVITSADPDGSSYDYWLTEVVRDDDGRVSEVRTPAANTGYNHNTSGTTAEPYGKVTASTSVGLIEVFVASDQTGLEFLPEHVKWKEGTSGDAYLVSTIEYLDRRLALGTDDAVIKVPMPQYAWQYTEETITAAQHGVGTPPSGAYETQISRTFHETTDDSDVDYIGPATTTVTMPAVSTANNGSGTANTTSRYQLEDGRTQYTKAADGIIGYTGYDDVTGMPELVVQDVDTYLSGFNEPSGFSSSGAGSHIELHQYTEFTYDDQGRSNTVKLHAHSTDGDERVTQTVYHILSDERVVTLSIPRFVDSTTDTWYGPVGYSVSNHAGRSEASGLIAISSSGTTSDPTTWINEAVSDPITAVTTGTLARYATTQYDESGVRADSSRVYHTIPSSGAGSVGTNYDQTSYAYDDMGRMIRVEDPTGTVSRTVYDDLGRTVSREIGTDDTGDPGGDLGGTNNMVATDFMEYDGNADGGNSLLTKVTNRVQDGATDERVTSFINDARGRTIVVVAPAAPYSVSKYDNLGRVTASASYSSVSGFDEDTDPTTTTTGRMSLSRAYYDERGRVYQSRVYKIVQSTGAIAQSLGSDLYLYSKNWYDSVGRPIKSLGEQVGKTAYDRLGRPTHSFVIASTDDSAYGDADDVAGDVVLEESQTVYDEDTGSVLLSASISRFHDDYGTGETTGPLDLSDETGGDGDPLKYTAADIKGRIQISASWYDEWDRLEDTAHYGTNDGSTFTYPAGPPTRSPSGPQQTTLSYNDDGTVLQTEDPGSTKTRFEYDDLGRQVAVISNYTSGSLTDPDRDNDTYVRYTFDDGLQTEMWVDVDGDGAKDSGVDQVTTYSYGVTTTDSPGASEIYAHNLLRQVTYPDSASGSDVVRYAYNARGEQVWTQDQAGNVIETLYDDLGRPDARKATTIQTGAGFDDAVQRIDAAYDSRGMVSTVTQYSDASATTTVDQVKHEYDDWGLLDKIHQDFNSAVSVGSGDELTVDFTHDTDIGGVARALRRTGVTLPDGTAVTYTYSLTNDRYDNGVSRVTSVKVGTTIVAAYDYLGLAQVVGTELPEPELLSNRFAPGAASGVYARLDRFGRITTDTWTRGIDTDTNGSYDVYRDFYEHAIDWTESSNIDLVQDAVYPGWDVAYTNDGLERLETAQRGDWGGSSISNQRFLENWTLSQTGNWELHQLGLNSDSDFTDADELNDDGTFNLVNELTARDTDDNGTDNFTLTYDAAGNMTDDGEDYEYVYDVWGRLRKVLNTSTQALVAEYTYNGLGHRTGWHYDVDADGTVETNSGANSDDPWYHWVHDDRWRQVATYRVLHYNAGGGWTWDNASHEDYPKEDFVYHAAGLAGNGSSSYIDGVILRDADSNTAWDAASDGTLEERTYTCQNWRADVVALATDAGQLIQQMRYDPYGVPFGISKADVNGDGVVNSQDSLLFGNLWNSGNGTHVFADWNFDGAVNTSDYLAFLNSYSGDTDLGRGVLGYDESVAGGNNRKGYAGYELDPELTKDVSAGHEWQGWYHVRYRVYVAELGRWTRRDPLGYINGLNTYWYVTDWPLVGLDSMGLAMGSCGAGGCGRQPEVPGDPVDWDLNDPIEDKTPWWESDWECAAPCMDCIKFLLTDNKLFPAICRSPDPIFREACLIWLVANMLEITKGVIDCVDCVDCLTGIEWKRLVPRELPQIWPGDSPSPDNPIRIRPLGPNDWNPLDWVDPGKPLTICEVGCLNDWLEHKLACEAQRSAVYRDCLKDSLQARPGGVDVSFVNVTQEMCRQIADDLQTTCLAKAQLGWYRCVDDCAGDGSLRPSASQLMYGAAGRGTH